MKPSDLRKIIGEEVNQLVDQITEGKGQDLADKYVAKLRSEFRKLNDDELDEFRETIAKALDLKESVNEGAEYYVIQSKETGSPKYVKDIGWRVRDNSKGPKWVSDRKISKAYKFKTLKDAQKYLDGYADYQNKFWSISKLKESVNEGPGQKHYTKDGKEWTGPTHKMPDGTLMTGDPHNDDSEELSHESVKESFFTGHVDQIAQKKFKKDWEQLSKSEKKWVSDEVRKKTESVNEGLTVKSWHEETRPNKIMVKASNGKTLEITPKSNYKEKSYQAWLQGLDQYKTNPKAASQIDKALTQMANESVNEGNPNTPVKVGDILYMDGRKGKVVKVMQDMANVDFGKGDVYGIMFNRIEGDTIGESMNEAMMAPKAAKKLKIGSTVKTEKGTYTITGYGQKSNAEKVFEVENENGEKFNMKVSLRGSTAVDIAKFPSLRFDLGKGEILEKTMVNPEVGVDARFSKIIAKIPNSKITRDIVLKAAKKFNMDPDDAIAYVEYGWDLDLDESVNEVLSKEDRLKIAKSSLVKAEKNGDDKLKKLALATIDLIKKESVTEGIGSWTSTLDDLIAFGFGNLSVKFKGNALGKVKDFKKLPSQVGPSITIKTFNYLLKKGGLKHNHQRNKAELGSKSSKYAKGSVELTEGFGDFMDPSDVATMLDIAARWSSTQHQAANQSWSYEQDLYDYLKSDHVPKKYHKDFYKAVKRAFTSNRVKESVNEVATLGASKAMRIGRKLGWDVKKKASGRTDYVTFTKDGKKYGPVDANALTQTLLMKKLTESKLTEAEFKHINKDEHKIKLAIKDVEKKSRLKANRDKEPEYEQLALNKIMLSKVLGREKLSSKYKTVWEKLKKEYSLKEAKIMKKNKSINEAKFNKNSLLKAMKKADGMITVNRGKQYVIYNPKKGDDSNIESNSGRGGQDFWDMWQDKVIFGVDEDGEEHEIRYSDIEDYNESVSEGVLNEMVLSLPVVAALITTTGILGRLALMSDDKFTKLMGQTKSDVKGIGKIFKKGFNNYAKLLPVIGKKIKYKELQDFQTAQVAKYINDELTDADIIKILSEDPKIKKLIDSIATGSGHYKALYNHIKGLGGGKSGKYGYYYINDKFKKLRTKISKGKVESISEVTLKKGDILKFKTGAKWKIVNPHGDGYRVKVDQEGNGNYGRNTGWQPQDWLDMMFRQNKVVVEGIKESVSEGLWDNVRKKKARGESPAKPGDDEYPDSKAWKDAQESVEEDFNIGKQNTSERDRFMKFMFKNGEANGKYDGKSVTVSTNGAKKDPRKWTVEFTKTGKSIKFIDTIASLVVKEGKLTEIRKGDYVGSGKEVGLVNKVSGSGANQVAYVKFNSRPKSFHPILARNLTKTGKKHKGKDLYQEGKINEASRGKIHKAAKKGSYPVTIVVINSGMVVKQELVDTPAAVPAAFNELQKQYPNAIISIESNTGETLFSESVNEGKEQTVAKGKWEIVKVPKGSNNSTRFGDRYYLLLGGQHVGGSVTANGSFSPPSSGNSSEDYVMKILKKAKIVESVNEAQLQDLPIKSLLGLGKFATVSMGEKKLYKLSEAFEEWLIDNDDNTYEGITAHLDMAIELIQERENKEAVPHMNKFNKACGKALSRLK